MLTLGSRKIHFSYVGKFYWRASNDNSVIPCYRHKYHIIQEDDMSLFERSIINVKYSEKCQ